MKCQRCGTKFDGNYCPVCGEWVKREGRQLKKPSSDSSRPVHQKPARLRRPIYTRSWFILIMLFLFFPAGLYLMWKYDKFNKFMRALLTFLSIISFLFIALSLQSIAIHGTPFFLSAGYFGHGVPSPKAAISSPPPVKSRDGADSNESSGISDSDSRSEIETNRDGEGNEIPLDFEQYTSIVKQELSRYIINIKYSESKDDWNISQENKDLSITTKVLDSEDNLREIKVVITYQENRKYYEPLYIEYNGEILFDGNITN